MPLSPGSSHTHLSPKAKSLSTSPNFNPFSPLSPFQANKELEDDDRQMSDVESQSNLELQNTKRVVYSRDVLLQVGRRRTLSSWPKPKDMAPLHEWFGPAHTKSPMDDPAIASMGQGSGRRAGGYEEGFGLGGGIGGKGLGRGARPPGNTHNDTRNRRHDLDANGLPVHNKNAFSGQMGKFSVKAPGERLKPGGNDEIRGTREDWRRAGGPPQPPRQDRRQWVNHHEEPSQPAWMDDQAEIDPAIVVERDSTPFTFGAGNDPIAAHKRMMKGAGDSKGGSHTLVPFFAGQEAAPGKLPKAPKQVNAADYLLPGKVSAKATPVSTQLEPPPPSASHSRFQRFFGAPQPGLPQATQASDRQAPESPYTTPVTNPPFPPSHPFVATTTAQTPSVQSPPPSARIQTAVQPPQDHASRLMGMLMSPPPSSPAARPQQPPLHQQQQPQQYLHAASPAPNLPYARSAYTSPPPVAGGMMHVLDHRSPDYLRAYGPPPPPSFPQQFTGHYPNNYLPPPGMLPASTQTQSFPHPHHNGSLPPHAMAPNMPRPGYAYGPMPGTLSPPPQQQLGNPQQNLLAALYGNMHHGQP